MNKAMKLMMKAVKKKSLTEKAKGKYTKAISKVKAASGSTKTKSGEKDPLTHAREELALCYRICERFKYNEGVCNHLSYEIQGENKFMLVKYGVHWSQVKMSDILVLDFE